MVRRFSPAVLLTALLLVFEQAAARGAPVLPFGIPNSLVLEAAAADPDLLGAIGELELRARLQAMEDGRAKKQQRRGKALKCRKGSPGIIIQKPIQNEVLPLERPPNWDYCSEQCKKNVTIVERTPGNEGIYIQVAHKPIPGVSPEMMLWWFSGNIEGSIVHPADGKTYSRYLVWHPLDHIHEITVEKPPTPGSLVGAVREITEFIGTGHSSGRTTGYLRNETECEWQNEYYANDELEVAALDVTGLTLQLKIGFKKKPMNMRHDWSASDQGVLLVSTLNIGFPGDTNFIRWANNRYARRAFGGDNPMVMANLWVKHCLEEFSNLQHFLPDLYRASQRKKP